MTGISDTLASVCEFVIDCPHFTPEWTNGGYLVIRNQNIRDGRLDLSQPSFTNEDDFRRRNRRATPRPGDIIFTREAPMGEVCIVPEGLECCMGQRQVLLRPGKGIDGRYLFYALQSEPVRRQILWNEGTGSTVSNVRIPVLNAIRIPRLGPSESRIGAMLGSLDDKIELNRRMNETLEAMAQAIFRDWFVDFGPTRRKLAGVTDPIEVMGGLTTDATRAAELASLFPNALNDGGLPKSWEEWSLNQCAEVISGGTPSKAKAHFWSGMIPWISPKVMTSIQVHDADNYISHDAVLDGAKLVPSGTTLVMVRGMGLHDGMRVSQARTEVTFNQDVKAFLPKAGIPADFLFWGVLTLAPQIHAHVEASGHGTGKLSSDLLLGTKLAVSPIEFLPRLTRTLTLFSDRIDQLQRESRTLAATRDLLLPSLMSGEMRLRNAEAIAEATP